MTAPDAAGATLYAAMPTRAQVHVTRTKRLDHLAAQAFAHGWTLDQLVTRTTAGDLGANPGGVITSRLEWCADNPPPERAAKLRKIHDGCCEGGFIYDESGVDVVITKCPGNARRQEATA